MYYKIIRGKTTLNHLENQGMIRVSQDKSWGISETFVCGIWAMAISALSGKYRDISPPPEAVIVRNGVVREQWEAAKNKKERRLIYTLLWWKNGKITVCSGTVTRFWQDISIKIKGIVSWKDILHFPGQPLLVARKNVLK